MSDQYAKDAATIADICERDGEHSAAATIRGLLDERSDSLSEWGQMAELEFQLSSLTEENERLRAIIEEDGCWGSREEARQALSPIDPPLVQEMKGP